MRIEVLNYIVTITKKNSIVENEIEGQEIITSMEEGVEVIMNEYNAIDIARYVIDHCIRQGTPISNLQLQKILYYIQASFLARGPEAPGCFREDILSWDYGPVVREVYNEFRRFSSNPITTVPELTRFTFENGEFVSIKIPYNRNAIAAQDIVLINQVVDSYRTSTAFELVRKTHDELPWQQTPRNEIINRELIRAFYTQNENLLQGNIQ